MTRSSEADIAALKASGRFDEAWYASAYPDVGASGMDPAEHYLWIGARLGRRPLPPSAVSSPSSVSVAATPATAASQQLDALFIDGTNGTSSTPYRVFRIANGLTSEGWKVHCVKGEDLPQLLDQPIEARFVVVHRAPYWSPFIEFVKKMRALGSIIAFDVDDLVFDKEMIPYIDGYKYLNEDQKQAFLNGLDAYREFIFQADFCTTTTSYLVDEMRKMGKVVYRIPNAISSENINYFSEGRFRRDSKPTPFVIGYYSGTKTHQADFAVVAPALINFMKSRPDVVFRLVGEFDLTEWPELHDWQFIHRAGDIPRVTRAGLMPHDVMIRDQANCDIILAPLEVGNPFCEAKSELKFFEAALVGCPVIASSTRTFIEATDGGALAHLATTTSDWLNALNHIYENYAAELNRATRAGDLVRYRYSQKFAAAEAKQTYLEFEASRRGEVIPTVLEEKQEVADIGVILPDFSGPSGGHRKIFTVCKALEEKGYSVCLHFYSDRQSRDIRSDISKYFFNLNADIKKFTGSVNARKGVICTQWRSAYDLRATPFNGKIWYFVQDFEPMFYAVGSDYIRAISSYNTNFDMVCYGKWVSAKIEDEIGIKSKVIPFTLDHSTYAKPINNIERDVDILLFARPSQDRRCFNLIAEGLRQIVARNANVRIGLFGENDYGDLGFAYQNYGSIADLTQLAALYHRTKVGICYSPTNPSQLGYEMLACGASLVDVRIKFAELNFGGEDFVRYCNGTPEDMRDACEALLADDTDRARRQQLGYAFIQAMPDDADLGRAFIQEAGL